MIRHGLGSRLFGQCSWGLHGSHPRSPGINRTDDRSARDPETPARHPHRRLGHRRRPAHDGLGFAKVTRVPCSPGSPARGATLRGEPRVPVSDTPRSAWVVGHAPCSSFRLGAELPIAKCPRPRNILWARKLGSHHRKTLSGASATERHDSAPACAGKESGVPHYYFNIKDGRTTSG
jgi:hypothetical protein